MAPHSSPPPQQTWFPQTHSRPSRGAQGLAGTSLAGFCSDRTSTMVRRGRVLALRGLPFFSSSSEYSEDSVRSFVTVRLPRSLCTRTSLPNLPPPPPRLFNSFSPPAQTEATCITISLSLPFVPSPLPPLPLSPLSFIAPPTPCRSTPGFEYGPSLSRSSTTPCSNSWHQMHALPPPFGD